MLSLKRILVITCVISSWHTETSVVLLRCPLVAEIMHGGAVEDFARKSPYNLYSVGAKNTQPKIYKETTIMGWTNILLYYLFY